jgi:hypothetical protein
MSFAMKFSNRFAALDEETSRPAAAAPATTTTTTTTTTTATTTTDAARMALGDSSNAGAYRPPHSIFRRGNAAAADQAPAAFQNMRGTSAEGSDWKYQRAPGYKGIFPNAATGPAPKTYEEEYPTLGGKPKGAATAAAAPAKTGYASLAKSWGDKAAEEKLAAEAAAAQAAKEAERRHYEAERNSNLYSALAFRRRCAIQDDPAFDYNQEYNRQNPGDSWDEPEDDCPPQHQRSTTPPMYKCDFPEAHEAYDEDEE